MLVQRLYPFSDAGRQRLRNGREPGGREVDVLVEYGVEQADCEQRITLRLPEQPRSQAWWRRRPSEYPLGQLTHMGLLEPLQVQTGQHAVLLEPEQDVFAQGAFDHLAESSAHQHKHAAIDHVASDVIQHLPRRSVSKMHVVQEHDHRLFSCEVRKHDGQCFTNVRRRHVQPPRPVKPGRSSKNAAEVGHIPAAQAHHLVVGAVPKVAVEEFRPQPKRCGRAREVPARPQGENTAATARQEVRCEPGLADTRFPVDHDASEPAPMGGAKPDGERAHLGVPADEWNRTAVLLRHLSQSKRETTPTGPKLPYRMPYQYGSSARPYAPGWFLNSSRPPPEEAMPNELLDERLIGSFMRDLGALMHAATVLVGDRLGLYKAMADCSWLSPDELAARTDTDTRYIAEWLAAQAASGYADYEAHTGRFRLSKEQAFVLTSEFNPCSSRAGFKRPRR